MDALRRYDLRVRPTGPGPACEFDPPAALTSNAGRVNHHFGAEGVLVKAAVFNAFAPALDDPRRLAPQRISHHSALACAPP